MKETNPFEESANQEKLLTHILPTTLFCEECGITETSPSFGQQYCRYCGVKFKNKPWIYEESKEAKIHTDGCCNTCKNLYSGSCKGCAVYDEYDNLITLSHYEKETEDED